MHLFNVSYLVCLAQHSTGISILQQQGTLERKGSGRPLKITGDEMPILTQLALGNPTFPTNTLAEIFSRRTGILVHGSTVRRSLSVAGINMELLKINPQMTQVHHEKRGDFAATWQNYHFQDVLSHECVFQLHRNKLKFGAKVSKNDHTKARRSSPRK